MANLKVTLVKSTIGALKDQQATVKALGLHKLNHTVIKPDNACTVSYTHLTLPTTERV